MKHLGTVLAALVVLAVVGLAIWRMLPSESAADRAEAGECSLNEEACSETIDGVEVRLDISPRPIRPFEPLRFEVLLDEGESQVDEVWIDLNMPAMDMGTNRVKMRAESDHYVGTGTVTACPSGADTWRARVELPGRGEAEFLFDIVR